MGVTCPSFPKNETVLVWSRSVFPCFSQTANDFGTLCYVNISSNSKISHHVLLRIWLSSLKSPNFTSFHWLLLLNWRKVAWFTRAKVQSTTTSAFPSSRFIYRTPLQNPDNKIQVGGQNFFLKATQSLPRLKTESRPHVSVSVFILADGELLFMGQYRVVQMNPTYTSLRLT